jgi:pectinesterase inhibitor-like protein
MKTCFLLVAAVAAAAFASAHCSPAQAAAAAPPRATTIGATCQAAHDADSRVSASFCNTRLGDAFAPDTRYLAVAAAGEGVSNANDARREISTAIQRHDEGDDQEADPIYRRVLELCEEFYGIVRERYEAARQAIAEQRYGDVEEELLSVPSTGRSCDDKLALSRGGSGAPPFLQYCEDNTQIALLTIAITSLIK